MSIFTGTPRESIFEIRDDPRAMFAIAWTLVDGDFLFAFERESGGTTIQLWQTQDRPGLPGVQVITQLNITKICFQLAGDPANPGLVAASFDDGTFALYYLNLTPYPPPPEELAGEDVGPINGNGTQGNGEIEPQTLADFAYLIGIVVALVILLALLIWLKREEDEGEEDEEED